MSTFQILRLITGAFLAASLAPLGSSSIAVAVPLIAESVGTNVTLVTRLLVGGYLLICIVGQVPGGRFADRWGTSTAIYTGLGIYAFGSVLGFFVHDLVSLTVSRMLMALGVAIVVPASTATLRTRLPPRFMAMAFGIYGTSMSAAATLGPWLGALIAGHLHWRYIFAVNIPIVLLAAVLIFTSVARSDDSGKNVPGKVLPFDWTGMALLTAAIVSMQLCLDPSGQLWLLGPVALVLFWMFVLQERRHVAPLIAPALLAQGNYAACCSITGLNNFIMYAVLFQTPIVLMAFWDVDTVMVGNLLLAMTLGMMINGLLAGFILPRLGPRRALWSAQLLTLAGLFLLAATDPGGDLTTMIGGMVCLGLGVGMTMAVSQSTALAVIPKQSAGTASGTFNTARYLGGAVGIAVMGLVLAGSHSTHWPAHQMLYGIHALVCLLVCGATLWVPSRFVVAD